MIHTLTSLGQSLARTSLVQPQWPLGDAATAMPPPGCLHWLFPGHLPSLLTFMSVPMSFSQEVYPDHCPNTVPQAPSTPPLLNFFSSK